MGTRRVYVTSEHSIEVHGAHLPKTADGGAADFVVAQKSAQKESKESKVGQPPRSARTARSMMS